MSARFGFESVPRLESARLVLREADPIGDLEGLFDVTLGNAGSARVLKKLGFQEEGVLRQRGFWKGDYHDLRILSLLREEWPG